MICMTFLIIALSLLYLFRKKLYKQLIIILSRDLYAYQKERRPNRIILIRHGRSKANGNYDILQDIADNTVHLADEGIQMAKDAGKKLKEIIGNETIRFYVSPYQRTKETYENILLSFKDNPHFTSFEPQIREQEFGNLQADMDKQFAIQKRVGVFYYRFVDGESGADVYDRSSLFMSSLFREFASPDYHHYDNVIIVTHALTIMFWLMRFLNYSVSDFYKIREPGNCEFVVLEKNAKGRYEIKTDVFTEEAKQEMMKQRGKVDEQPEDMD